MKSIRHIQSSVAIYSNSKALLIYAERAFMKNNVSVECLDEFDTTNQANYVISFPEFQSTLFVLSRDSKYSTGVVVYTSGSSGERKKRSFSLYQLDKTADVILERLPEIVEDGAGILCWLPMSALYQRMMNYIAWKSGAPLICIQGSPINALRVLSKITTNFLFGVPLLFTRLRELISQYAVANHIDLSKSATVILGPRVRFLLSGSAKCSLDLISFFERCGVPLLEAYGMTESIMPIALSSFKKRKAGTVGQCIEAQQIQINQEGILSVSGEYLAYECLEESIIVQTEDVVSIDDEGFLSVVGRLGEIIKLQNGRKISLTEIENHYELLEGIENVVIEQTSDAELRGIAFCKETGRLSKELILEIIKSRLLIIPDFVKVEQWLVIERPPLLSENELTVTGKLRRNDIFSRHKGAHFSYLGLI